MLTCPACSGQNVFITRAAPLEYFDKHRETGPDPLRPDHQPPPGETTRTMRPAAAAPVIFSVLPPEATCRDCGTTFTHSGADCPPAAELVALIGDQVSNGTHVAGLKNGARIKDYVFWTEATGLAIPVSPADKYQKIYNMAILARFGGVIEPPAPAPAAPKPKRRPAAKKPAK